MLSFRAITIFIGLVSVAGLTSRAGAQPPIAASRADAMCRTHLFAGVGKLARDTIVQLGKCHSQRMAGRLPASTDCNSSATAPQRLLLERDEDSLRERVRKRCEVPDDVSPPSALGFAACPAPCDAAIPAISTYADVAECLICGTRAVTSQLVASAYGSPPVPTGDEQRCQKHIGRALKTYLGSYLGAQRRCRLGQDLGRINPAVDCRTTDPRGRTSNARQAMQNEVGACNNSQLLVLDSCGNNVPEQQQCLPAYADGSASSLYALVFGPQQRTIALGSAAAPRGEVVGIPATLSGGAGVTTSVEVFITFDRSQVQVVPPETQDQCGFEIATDFGPVLANKWLVADLLPPVGTSQTLRVTVFDPGPFPLPIPDGGLFHCYFLVNTTANVGVVDLVNVSAGSGFAGDSLPTAALDGAITVQPNGLPSIDVGSATGNRDDTVPVTVSLNNSAGQVASLTSAITYHASQVDVDGDVLPSCTIDPSIGSGSAADKMLQASIVTVGGAFKTLQVTIANPGNTTLIPDGPLFSCDFRIAPTATPGAAPLTHAATAANAAGSPVLVAEGSGSILIVVPQLNLGSTSGAPEDVVAIPATLSVGGEVVDAQFDITFDTSQVHVVLNSGVPDCIINPNIGAGSFADKQLQLSILPAGGTMEMLRVLVTSPTNTFALPAGPLFVCHFQLDTAASGIVTLANAPSAADAAGNAVSVIGADSSIGVNVVGLPLVDVGDAAGNPGDVVMIQTAFANGSEEVAAVSVDIIYDATKVRVARVGPSADCTIDPSIGPGTSTDKMLLRSVADLGGGMERLRVAIVSFNNGTLLPDGPLFHCRFAIDPAAPAGNVLLQNTPQGGSPFGDPVVVYGSAGSITVF